MRSHQHTIEAINLCLAANIPVVLWGLPGVGKTAALNAAASKQGWVTVEVATNLYMPGEIGGQDIVENGALRRELPEYARTVMQNTDQTHVLFFDEINTGTPQVLMAVAKVVHERRIENRHFPDHMRIVCAGNPTDVNPLAYDLPSILANRMVHIDWTPDAAYFSSSFISGEFKSGDIPVLPTDWKNGVDGVRRTIGMFFRLTGNFYHAFPEDDIARGKAWPSPRVWWEMVAPLMAAGRAAGASEEAIRLLVQGSVGLVASQAFFAWLSEMDLPDPEDVLADPTGIPIPDRDDKMFVMTAAVAEAIRMNPTPERLLSGLSMIERLSNMDRSDVAVQSATLMFKTLEQNTGLLAQIRGNTEFSNKVKSLRKVLTLSGRLEQTARPRRSA